MNQQIIHADNDVFHNQNEYKKHVVTIFKFGGATGTVSVRSDPTSTYVSLDRDTYVNTIPAGGNVT